MLAACTGLLLAAAFPPRSAYPLGFIALVPLLVATRGRSRAHAFSLGWLSGLVFHLVAWRWVLPAIARTQGISAVAAAPYFSLFASYHALQIAVFATIASAPFRGARQRWHAATVAASWVIVEACFPRLIDCYLGDLLAPAPLLRQLADVGGVYGLGFVLALVNSLVASAITPSDSRALRSRAAHSGWAVGMVALVSGYGAGRIELMDQSRLSRRESPAAVAVRIVQGDLEVGADDVAAANQQAWERYAHLTRRGILDTGEVDDLIIWPETTLRAYLRHDTEYLDRLRRLMQEIDAPILLGALDRHEDGQRELNSAYLLQPSGRTEAGSVQAYRKRRLLPFGEKVPWDLSWQTTGNFVAAPDSESINLELFDPEQPGSPTRFAPTICFEAIRAGAYNDAVLAGAAFLVNLTDDAWFGDTDEPDQHLNATILRAVESRRWLVRASNSGISAFIDPTGKIDVSLSLGQQGEIRRQVAILADVTPYVRFGNWPVVACALICAMDLWRKPRLRRHVREQPRIGSMPACFH